MVKIKMTKGYEALIDDEDFELINKYSWYAEVKKNHVYAKAHNIGNGHIKHLVWMHRLILGLDDNKGKYVDHINRDSLDNRRCNLRITDHAGNQMNTIKRKNCSSIYKGVAWHPAVNKWFAYITIMKKRIYLGWFINETEAARTYDMAAREHFKDYACVNFE